jgi:lipoate---protein ligase
MLILDPATDPFFNLAAEEFLLREADGPVLRLWRNAPCVVIGRHQIPCREADVALASRRGVPVLRRLSGGGAVYHDLGNVNFTVIRPLARGEGVDFDRLLVPVVAALRSLGVIVTHAGRGDVRFGGAKISGNAAYLWKGRILHHGTLLFDADTATLDALLDPPAGAQRTGKGIRSVRSTVANLRAATGGRFADAWDFAKAVAGQLSGDSGDAPRAFTDEEKAKIEALATRVSRTPEWNLGAGPEYALERVVEGGGTLRLGVSQGRISSVALEGDVPVSAALAKALTGAWHEPVAVEQALAAIRPTPSALPGVSAFF